MTFLIKGLAFVVAMAALSLLQSLAFPFKDALARWVTIDFNGRMIIVGVEGGWVVDETFFEV